MANLTKANLVEELHQRGVSVPSGSPKKELLVKLYRQDVLNDDRFTSGDYSSDEDVRDTTKEHDDSCTLPGCPTASRRFQTTPCLPSPATLVSRLALFSLDSESVREAASAAAEQRQLRQLLNNGSVPTNPSSQLTSSLPQRKKEPQSSPRTTLTMRTGGTPLQKGPTKFSPLSVRSVRFNLSNSNSPGVNEAVQPGRRSFTCSARSSSLPQDGSPVHMTLRFRAGTRGEVMASHSAATTPAVGKQRRMYMAVKVLIVLVVITVNVLIYLRAPVEQGMTPRAVAEQGPLFRTAVVAVRNRVKNRFEHHLDAVILPGFSVVGLDSASLCLEPPAADIQQQTLTTTKTNSVTMGRRVGRDLNSVSEPRAGGGGGDSEEDGSDQLMMISWWRPGAIDCPGDRSD
ncbi:hypothetical protein HPB47_011825 [Ixodes persulcatus]|uniref:Uncharacterized protein n=1 Tax=Ixodes persulcatus TaxID=34615 RepID=A0AC60NV53_IXOPE|nr:hypothetical protein HPB47_011825 [Ixodes persulcatus]